MSTFWQHGAFYKVFIPVVALIIVALAILNLLDAVTALSILNLLGIALVCSWIARLSASAEERAPAGTVSDEAIARKIAALEDISSDISRTANETFDLLEKWANFLAAHSPDRPADGKAPAQRRLRELHRQGKAPDRVAGELRMSRDEALLEVWRLRGRGHPTDRSVDPSPGVDDSRARRPKQAV